MKTATLLSTIIFGSALLAQGQTVPLNEQFTDGERSTEALPSSALWTYGAHNNANQANAFTSLDASGNSLVWDHTNNGNNSFSAIWAHFAPGNAPIVLNEGETIKLTFEVTFSGGAFVNQTNAFRWALFDSGNSRVTTDFHTTTVGQAGIFSGSTFSGWDGYAAQTTVHSAAIAGSQFSVRERTGTGNGLFTGAEYTDLPPSLAEEGVFSADVTYAGSLSITKTASGAEVIATIGGTTTNLALDATPVTEFDTVSFFVIDAMTHNIALDNIQVEVVPEPATAGMLAMGALGLAARRRRTR